MSRAILFLTARALLVGVGDVCAGPSAAHPEAIKTGGSGAAPEVPPTYASKGWELLGPLDSDRLEDQILRRAFSEGAELDRLVLSTRLRSKSKVAGDEVNFRSSLGLKEEDKPTGSVFLARTALDCVSEHDVYAVVGGDDAVQVMLNGEVVYGFEQSRKFFGPSAVVKLGLRKGPNRLVVVSRNVAEGKQRFVLEIFSALDSAIAYYSDGGGGLLQEQLVGFGMSPDFVWGSAGTEHVRCEFASMSSDATRKETMDLAHLLRSDVTGLYEVRITVTERTFTEHFLYGDPLDYAGKLMLRLQQIAQPDYHDVSAEMRRLRALLDAADRRDGEWGRKLVFTALEGEALLQMAGCGREPSFRGREGLHFRGFRSAIDGQEQFYRIYMPRCASAGNGKVPLAVLVPTANSADRPFIESVFAARQTEAERWVRIADELGIGILWMGYRTQPNGNLADIAYAEEVFRDVEADDAIDRGRVFLIATCRAGATALLYARYWPERFSAVGLVDPIVRGAGRAGSEPTLFRRESGYREWAEMLGSLPNLCELNGVPLLVVQDGAESGHGSILDATELQMQGTAQGQSVRLDRLPSSVLHLRSWRLAMEWGAKQSRAMRSTAVSKRFNMLEIEATVSGSVMRPFIVVEPTCGDDVQLAKARAACSKFVERWQASQYGPCRTIRDMDVSPEVERSYNLVVIGSGRTNGVWARLGTKLEVEEKDGLYFRGEAIVSETDYKFIIVRPTPGVPERNIVLIGGRDEGLIDVKGFDLARDGWFHVGVWTGDGERLLFCR